MENLKITLKIQGPFVTSGVGIKNIGIDVNQLTDGNDIPIISGTHIKGRIKYALLQLCLMHDDAFYLDLNIDNKNNKIDFWNKKLEVVFGAEGYSPSPLIFENFILQEANDAFSVVNRIAISRITGTAKEGALAYIEGAKSGKGYLWSGRVLIPSNGFNSLTQKEIKDLIVYGFLWLDKIGAQKTVGWGKIIARDFDLINLGLLPIKQIIDKLKNITQEEYRSTYVRTLEENTVKYENPATLIIKLESPLLVADHSARGNFFECRDDIPGSVIKRALADAFLLVLGERPGNFINKSLLNQRNENYKELIEKFSLIFIKFALPVHPYIKQADMKRPMSLPLTAFVNKGWNENDGGPWDILTADLLKEGRDYISKKSEKRITFKLDNLRLNGWQTSESDNLFIPNHFIQTRTSIECFTQGSEEAKLFSYRAINNIYTKKENKKKQCLLSEIIFPESDKLKKQIFEIINSVKTIGKTSRQGLGKVIIEPINYKSDNWEERLGRFNEIVSNELFLVPVMLATEAVLLEPFKVDLSINLKDMYEVSWEKIFNKFDLDVKLKKFYTHHKIRGNKQNNQCVAPVVLTCAGSVFVLGFDKTKKDKINETFKEINLFGIEIPEFIYKIEENWHIFCPFRKTNGYGEIKICHPIHIKGAVHDIYKS